MVNFDFVFYRYENIIIYEDSDEINILSISNDKKIAEDMYDKHIKQYSAIPVITRHFKIMLLDIDRDAEIKSYDSRTDIC